LTFSGPGTLQLFSTSAQSLAYASFTLSGTFTDQTYTHLSQASLDVTSFSQAPGAPSLGNFGIGAKIVRAGSFTPVSVPPRLLADDAVGWLEGDCICDIAVRVRISERLARTVTSRNWQRWLRLGHHDDGGVSVALHAGDLDQIIRWSFGYGTDAYIEDPPVAVQRARELLAAMSARYDEQKRTVRGDVVPLRPAEAY